MSVARTLLATLHSDPNVLVQKYNGAVASEKLLPGCFSTQFRSLELERILVFLSTTSLVSNARYIKLIGDSIIHAFSAIFSKTSNTHMSLEIPLAKVSLQDPPSELEPEVILVNWDLHHPIFSPLSKGS